MANNDVHDIFMVCFGEWNEVMINRSVRICIEKRLQLVWG